MADKDQTLKEISARIDKLGDLPIFSASVNRIRLVSSKPESTAMALSKEALKDVNLTTKILRLANSPYYNRGTGKISVISRAVVVLGFNTIKNLCLTLKLIESFQHEHPSIEMNKMLVNAYLGAGFVREIALKCGIKDVEESYTCALLHNLGEIMIAYFLPEKHLEMEQLRQTTSLTRRDIEQSVFGTSIKDIGQEIAKTWEFPSTIVSTMEKYDPTSNDPVRGGVQLNRALASLASDVVDKLNDSREPGGLDFNQLIEKIADTAGLDPASIEARLVDSYKMSCELASNYGLDQEMLMPSMEQTGDEIRDRLASKLSFLSSNYRSEHDEDFEPAANEDETDRDILSPAPDSIPVKLVDTYKSVTPIPDDGKGSNRVLRERIPTQPDGLSAHEGTAPPAVTNEETTIHPVSKPIAESPATSRDANAQLEIIQEITALIANNANLHTIFSKVLEGLHRGVGFSRSMLCLLSPDRKTYTARIAYGEGSAELKQYFNFPLDDKRDLFSKIIVEGNEILVSDINGKEWEALIHRDFNQVTGASAFIIASLRAGPKPIGFFYADNAHAGNIISTENHRGFMQFVSQARLALQISGSLRK